MQTRPSNSLAEEFGGSVEMEPLDGGEGQCWLAGDIILKPCDNSVTWHWLAKYLPTVVTEGFRLPLPVCSSKGHWVVDGWCAQETVDGKHPNGDRWTEVLETVERFHQATKHLPQPEFLTRRTDPWSLGDRVAWEEYPFQRTYEPLSILLDLRRPLQARAQFVHGDFSENVLFSEHQPPAVIDISPYWRPVGYAFAIVVADAVCWRNADPTMLLKSVSHVDQFPQHLVRALIFRMTTTIIAAQEEPELAGYDPGIDLVRKLLA